jgi:hypothetical protein
MQGRLTEKGPLDLLAELRDRQAAGVLRLQEGQAIRQLFVEGGVTLRYAASNVAEESITILFRKEGGVGEEQIRQAACAKQGHELLGTTLLRMGFLAPDRLAILTREHILRTMRIILAMRDGTFEFAPGALPFREQLDTGMHTAEVLLDWTRSCTDLEWIRQRLGSADSRVEMATRPPAGYQQISLKPVEGFTMSRVDGQATVREICIVSPMGEDDTLRALCGLLLAGIIRIPDAPASMPLPVAGRATVRPATPPPGVVPSRIPGNGGAPKPATAPGGAGGATAGAAGPAGTPGHRPAGAAPQAGRKPVARPMLRRPAPPPKGRLMADADLETEMLQRFDQMRDQDLYQVLGVVSSAQTDEIRRAYYGLAKRYHPDKFIREEVKQKAEKVFSHITEAYATLSTAETRAKYDEDRASRRPKGPDKAMDGHEMARLNFKHGRDQFAKGRIGEAIPFFQNACDQDPAKAEYFYWLAKSQARNPRWKKDAEENFLKAIQIDPSNGECYAELGALYARGGVQSKARDMFTKALQWDPGNAVAIEGLAALDDKRGGLLGMLKAK